MFCLGDKRVWVAGHRGMVGSALIRRLARTKSKPLTVDRAALDLRRQIEVERWMVAHRPQVVFIAAATVGGIAANLSRPADFIYDNISIANNIIAAAASTGVEKLMFLGSSCMYPRMAEQPMAETMLMTGTLEPSSTAYALAKLAGVGLCQAFRRQNGCDFICAVPTNLFGPGDNLDPAASHVIPAMIRKVRRAKASGESVEIWGSGEPTREFLHVDDAADALVFLMENYSSEDIINIGGGHVLSIRELATLVAEVVGYRGSFFYNTERPDGMPRKQLNASRLSALGWQPSIGFRDGLAAMCRWMADIERKFD